MGGGERIALDNISVSSPSMNHDNMQEDMYTRGCTLEDIVCSPM